MQYCAAIVDRWPIPSVLPGGHVVFLTSDENLSIQARCAGMSLRDTILILGPAAKTSFAFLFRCKSDRTVVDSSLEHGTGPIDIDACRIKSDLKEFFSATGKPRSGSGHAQGYGMSGEFGGSKANPPSQGGRWPTNLVFIHSGGCRIVGSRTVTTGIAHRVNGGGKTFGGDVDKPPMDNMSYGQNGKETVPQFECEQDCSVFTLDQQSGIRPSTLSGRANPNSAHEHPSSAKTDSWFSGGAAKASQVYADLGGASRFYPQFKTQGDFIEWVIRLITTPGGDVYVQI